MNRSLRVFPFDGINTDSLGNYLVGLGLLAVTAQRWPGVRGCWRNDRFLLLSDQITNADEIKQHLLTAWRPSDYERWWSTAQKADTKAKSSRNLWQARNERSLDEVKLLDSHVVGMGRNCFNPVFGTGGNIGKRDLAKAWKDSIKLLSKTARTGWLEATLHGTADCGLPELASGGTWFVFANKMFNSGQGWYREGQLSPWSFLLSMEGAFLLVGGVNRRLGSHSRPYAVFPFVSEPSQPETDGEIGLARADFWAPLWTNPATLGEVEGLLRRGMARLGGRAAKAPSEFAVAALTAAVDAGVAQFARYELRQTTSSQVFEAIPREHIKAVIEDSDSAQDNPRAVAAKQLLALLSSGWIERLPYEPRDVKQKGKFVGLRGPVEAAIVRASERPADPTRWQELLLRLADTQTRIDRNKNHRERCAALRPLHPKWFELAFPSSNQSPPEIEMARAVASIGWPANTKTGDMPFLANIFGIEVTGNSKYVTTHFPKARTAQAVWGTGDAQQMLLAVAHRRLVDANKQESKPFAAASFCSAELVNRLLRGHGAIDLESVVRWIPAMSLIDWSKHPTMDTVARSETEFDGPMLLQALARPLFHGRSLRVWNKQRKRYEPFFPYKFEALPELQRRVFNLLRFNSLDEAIQILRNRYLAAGCPVVIPSQGFEADGEMIASSLLIPISDQAVISGFSRWLQPPKCRSQKPRTEEVKHAI